jgi:hypothetical protein
MADDGARLLEVQIALASLLALPLPTYSGVTTALPAPPYSEAR